MENMIEITGVDLNQFVKDVYDLSQPQGMGFLHFNPGPLSDEQADEIVTRSGNSRRIALDTDYVNGRACKMTVFRGEEDARRLFIHDRWFDHSSYVLEELLKRHSIQVPVAE